MITRTSECKYCFQKTICSLAALSLEDEHPLAHKRSGQQGNFPAFLEMQATLTQDIKMYFKKFIECINLEQNAENERFTQKDPKNGGVQCANSNNARETKLRIVKIESNGNEGVKIELEKE
jgi:hypothetical protein